MLLQKIFLILKDKYSISMNEIEDLFDIEKAQNDFTIYDHICIRYESVLKIKFEAMYLEAKKKKNKLQYFLKYYLWKKAVNSNIEQDLFMNELTDFKDKFIVSVLEQKTIYKFRISDIVNLWYLALTKTDQLFVAPLKVKNPYTNMEFSKSALYNIYFKLLESGFIIPNLITSHVKYNLDIKMFTIRNYPELKELAILTFIREASYVEKYEHIINMLHDYRRDINYNTISSAATRYVQKKAVKVFNGHLFLYLESKFSCNPLIKEESGKRVKEKLKKLLEDEPRFGFSRGEVIRYVPLGERAEQRRRERDARMSPIPPATPTETPPPLPSTIRRRRRNNILSRPTLPPPPPPAVNTIVRHYTPPTRTTLPPLQINNYMYRPSIQDITTSSTESTTESLETPTTNVTLESTDTPDYITNLLNARNRARDILEQIDGVINEESTPESETLSDEPSPLHEADTEPELETDDEFSNEFGVEISLGLENPFEPRSELNRTPPIDNDLQNAITEPLLQPIRDLNTQQIIDRLDSVINNLSTNNETENVTENILANTTENNNDLNE